MGKSSDDVVFSEAMAQSDRSQIQDGMQEISIEGQRMQLLCCSKCEESPKSMLAARQIVHLLEGWLNYSAALSSLVRREQLQSLHLAYYAELRAVLSILSGRGINLARGDLFYLNSKGEKVPLHVEKAETHYLSWRLWEKWCQDTAVENSLLEQFKLGQFVTLLDLQNGLSRMVTSPSERISWASDLLLATKNDQEGRNMASYGTSLRDSNDINNIRLNYGPFLRSMFTLLQPSSVDLHGFLFDELFVLYILKQFNDTSSKVQLKNFLRDSPSCELWIDKLSRDYDLKVFSLAQDSSAKVENVLSRALILLRVSTFMLNSNLDNCRGAKDWIACWMRKFGIVGMNGQTRNLSEVCLDYTDELEQLAEGDKTDREFLSYFCLLKPSMCLSWGLNLQ